MPDTALMPDQSLQASLDAGGLRLRARRRHAPCLEAFGALDDWQAFADSWNDLDVDTYMADGGRYRRRRHAVYLAGAPGVDRARAARPHYQALDYNPLNGGVARWFTPVAADVGEGALAADDPRVQPGPVPSAGAGHRGDGRSRSISSGSKRGQASRAGPRRKGCTATAWTTCSCCSSTGATSPAARRRFSGRRPRARPLHADRAARRRAGGRCAREPRRDAGACARSVRAGATGTCCRDIQE